MRFGLDPTYFVAFMLATVRCGAFLAFAPPFAGAVPVKIRVGLSVALGLALTNRLTGLEDLPIDDFGELLGATVFQAVIGVALGMLVYVLFQAAMAAGSLVDTFTGLTAAQVFDPMSRTSQGPNARLYLLLATTIVFVTNGHLMLIAGLARSFDAAPLDGFRVDRMAALMTEEVTQFLLAAIQIGAPVLGALFITELLLGLASRAAPQMNILMVGFGVKGLVMLLVGGFALPILAFVVPNLIGDSLAAMWALIR